MTARSARPEWAERMEDALLSGAGPTLPNAAGVDLKRVRRQRRICRWLNRFAQFLAAFSGCMCGAAIYTALIGELRPGAVMLAVGLMIGGAAFGALVAADRAGGAR